MRKREYGLNLALELARITPDMMRTQYKTVKVDRWRKLSKYLGRSITGTDDRIRFTPEYDGYGATVFRFKKVKQECE